MPETPKEDIYDTLIAPLMAQIIAIAKDANIPMVASFQLDGEEDVEQGVCYCSTVIAPAGSGRLIDDLAKCVERSREPNFVALTITRP